MACCTTVSQKYWPIKNYKAGNSHYGQVETVLTENTPFFSIRFKLHLVKCSR